MEKCQLTFLIWSSRYLFFQLLDLLLHSTYRPEIFLLTQILINITFSTVIPDSFPLTLERPFLCIQGAPLIFPLYNLHSGLPAWVRMTGMSKNMT